MIVATRPPPEGPVRLLNAADLAALPAELPSGPVLYELDSGRLVIMPPPGYIHGAVESNLATALKTQGEQRGHGRACSGDVGIILWRSPDRVVGADAAFIANISLPVRQSPEGYLETIPHLVVEVRSKNDTQPYLDRKAQDYLTAGVRVVWVADPDARTVTEYRPNNPPVVFGDSDTLAVDDIIPGFRLPVRDAFQL